MSEAELLAAIVDAPDDDAPWSVFADWLIQRGDPRGELIQLELALEGMDEHDERFKATQIRVLELRAEHGDAWLAPYQALGLEIEFVLDRCIPRVVAGTPTQIARAAASLLAKAPLITGANVSFKGERSLEALDGCPLLPRLRSLAIGHAQPARSTGWEALRELPELHTLRLATLALQPANTRYPLAAPKLAHLVISDCKLERDALEPLAAMRSQLRTFAMASSHVGPRLGVLLAGHRFAKLAIPYADLGDGFAVLRPALADAAYLDLRSNKLAAADLAPLFAPGSLPNLRALWLGNNPVGDAFVERLVAWDGARRLRKLHLGNCGITDAGARMLASARLDDVRSLVLSGRRFSPETDAALVASPHLAGARIYAGDRRLARKRA